MSSSEGESTYESFASSESYYSEDSVDETTFEESYDETPYNSDEYEDGELYLYMKERFKNVSPIPTNPINDETTFDSVD